MNINLDDPEVKKVVLSRLKLINIMPFLGKLASTMRFYIIDDDNDVPSGTIGDLLPKTGYTDGRNIYYYRSFLKNIDAEQIVFLTAHEIMHMVYDHLSRLNGRDPIYWNMACDYVINDLLVKNKIGKFIEGALLDKNNIYTSDKTADEVYELLIKNQEKQENTIDIHLDLSGNQSSSNSSKDGTNISVKVKVYGNKELTKEDLEKIKNELKEKIITIYNQEKDNQSSLPGMVALGIDRIIDAIEHPKINWKNLLREFITSYMPYDISYHVISRKSFFSDFMFPGIVTNEKVEVWVAVDTSGSIDNKQLSEVKAELKSISDTFEFCEMNVLCFDTDVYNVISFDEFSTKDDILRYNFKGGGGTSLNKVFDYFKKNDITPKKLIVFTDGYIDGWGDPNYCDTIFIINKGGNKNVPYGVAIDYD